MGFKCGIIGLPNVGKSTLFNALTESNKAEAANYPFATIEPNIGRVAVPDQRLNILSKISKSEKTIPPIYEAIDFANSWLLLQEIIFIIKLIIPYRRNLIVQV